MHNYSKQDLKKSLIKLGLKKNDIIFCHSNIGFFGKMKNVNDKKKLCKIFFTQILNIIGSEGTLIVPTFSYNFFKKTDFIKNKTVSTMGIFSEYVRKKRGSLRSNDPNFSVAAFGKKKKYFTDVKTKNTYSNDSFFGKFHKNNGKILNFNFPGSTILHYYERILKVDYRFDKKFVGTINNKTEEWIVFSRYLNEKKFIHNPFKIMNLLRKEKSNNFSYLGNGEIFLIKSLDMFKFLKRKFRKDKRILIS